MNEKVIIYQLFPRIFGNRNRNRKPGGTIAENGCGKFDDFSLQLLRKIKDLGVTHIWYTGIIRHASTTDYSVYGIPRQHPSVVKGRAGSPYAIADYYDVDPDLATDVSRRMMEFESLIERTHRAGLKAIIDFVPNHVARQYHSVCRPSRVADLGENDDANLYFSPQNNFYYLPGEAFCPQFDLQGYTEYPARATGNDCFARNPSANDWYETIKLNYGVDYCADGTRQAHFEPLPDTWGKMLQILQFWASKGIDGIRCDMAEMVPLPFWKWAVEKLKMQFPNLEIIGEVYQPGLYEQFLAAGFDYLYDKVGMYDCLRGIVENHRPAADITCQWQRTDHFRSQMLYFLENHDEQRIASDFFSKDARKAFPAMTVMALLGKNPLMIYAGQEFGERGMDIEGFSGEDGRTTIFDYWSLQTLIDGYFEPRNQSDEARETKAFYQKILFLATTEKAVFAGEMFDLMYVNPHLAARQFVFLRKKDDELLLVAANFSSEDTTLDIIIPPHAFEHLQMKEGLWKAKELITGEATDLCLKSNQPVEVVLSPLASSVFKIKFNSNERRTDELHAQWA